MTVPSCDAELVTFGVFSHMRISLIFFLLLMMSFPTWYHFCGTHYVVDIGEFRLTGIRGRGQLKCDGTRAETRFRLSAKRTSPFQSARASVQSTTGSRGVRISGSNAGYTMFRASVKSTGYPLRSPVSPSLPLPCVTVCHHISNSVYQLERRLIEVPVNPGKQ